MIEVRIDEGVTVIAEESPTGEQIEGPATFRCERIWYAKRKTHDGVSLVHDPNEPEVADEPEPAPEPEEAEATAMTADEPEPEADDEPDVQDEPDVEIPAELPEDHSDLWSLAAQVARQRGDELTSRKGEDLREYLSGVRDE